MKDLKAYVKVNSLTNSPGEVAAEDFILEKLKNLPYFQDHTDYFGGWPLPGDGLNRRTIWALYKGREDGKTIVLIHHHDVVSVEEFGPEKDLAFSVDELMEAFRQKDDLEAEVQKDLDSGDWYFGRGISDMKAGGLAHLETLKEAIDKELPINLLYLSLPDEENLSWGMRQAREDMDQLEKDQDLHYILCIDSESHTRACEDKFYYYTGSAGKVMINCYVRGKKTHIGEAVDGFNPLKVLGSLVAKTDSILEFCDRTDRVQGPPPSWSYLRDFKDHYDASTPLSGGGLYCQVTVSKTAGEVFKDFKALAEKEAQDMVDQYRKNYQDFYHRETAFDLEVLTYKEVYDRLKKKDPQGLKTCLEDLYEKHREDLDEGNLALPVFNFMLLDALADLLDQDRGYLILALSPPYYPYGENKLDEGLLRVLEETGEKIYGQPVEDAYFYMGISDLSYLSKEEDLEDREIFEGNCPYYGTLYSLPLKTMEKYTIPILDLGPWGKDIHKKTERVYGPHIKGELKDHYLAFVEGIIKELDKEK